MTTVSRRDFLWAGGLGAATAAGWELRSDAAPTPASGTLGRYADYLRAERQAAGQPTPSVPAERVQLNDNKRGNPVALPGKFAVTEDNILGPFYRSGAPFRGKVTPPLEPGKVMLINGRVWGFDTKKPLSGVAIDVWQANAQGRYDNDDPANPPAKDVFKNRTRVLTDETGYYEYETIHPAPYQTGPGSWRPSHIHYLIRTTGYKPLVTQLYFKGDKYNAADDFIKQSLIIDLREVAVGKGSSYEAGTFDIVLAPNDAVRK